MQKKLAVETGNKARPIPSLICKAILKNIAIRSFTAELLESKN